MDSPSRLTPQTDHRNRLVHRTRDSAAGWNVSASFYTKPRLNLQSEYAADDVSSAG